MKKAHTVCNSCPAGTYSDKAGSVECTKCPYGKYQDKPGQTKCLDCPQDSFSHIGAKTCFKLPTCTESDYRKVPDPIEKCYGGEDRKVVRRLNVFVMNWPGLYLCCFLYFGISFSYYKHIFKIVWPDEPPTNDAQKFIAYVQKQVLLGLPLKWHIVKEGTISDTECRPRVARVHFIFILSIFIHEIPFGNK